MVVVIKKKSTKEEVKDAWKKLEAHKLASNSKAELKKYCGILQLDENPLTLQKQWRSEWE